jgi:hypothetical protein
MRYSFSFREFVGADAQRQSAISHMEGLCAHLERLEYGDLGRRSSELPEHYSVRLAEALGILG